MNQSSHILDCVSALSARDFENLVFDCMRAMGIRNLVWRTPGADGGRDIEGIVPVRDISGYEETQSWYIECKRYSRSINWPTLWHKLSYADSLNADVLYLVTNSNPSPNCETEINRWNESKKKPSIRVWRGYDFPFFLRSNPSIAAGYGLLHGPIAHDVETVNLTNIILNITQSAHSAYEFGQNGQIALQAAVALTELLSHRLNDLPAYP